MLLLTLCQLLSASSSNSSEPPIPVSPPVGHIHSPSSGGGVPVHINTPSSSVLADMGSYLSSLSSQDSSIASSSPFLSAWSSGSPNPSVHCRVRIQDYTILDLGSSSVRGPPPFSPGGDEGEHPSELSEGLSLQSVPTFADVLQDFMEGHLQGVQEGGSL